MNLISQQVNNSTYLNALPIGSAFFIELNIQIGIYRSRLFAQTHVSFCRAFSKARAPRAVAPARRERIRPFLLLAFLWAYFGKEKRLNGFAI